MVAVSHGSDAVKKFIGADLIRETYYVARFSGFLSYHGPLFRVEQLYAAA